MIVPKMKLLQDDPSLDKDSSVPLYKQLEEIILESIESGRYRHGDKLPGELELSKAFGVSRITVRQSLENLSRKEVVVRKRGSGTYVSLPQSQHIQAVVSEEEWSTPLVRAQDEYNEENSDRPVKLEVEAVGRPNLRSVLRKRVAKGDAPDLALIDWAWLGELADLHYLKPIDELDQRWVREYLDDLPPVFQERNNYRGSLYGVQTEATTSVIWYRKDLLHREGIEPPTRWVDFLRTARYFKDPYRRKEYGLGPFPLAFQGGSRAGETTTFQLLSFIWAAGGEFYTQGRVVIDDKAVAVLRFLRDLVRRYELASIDVKDYQWNEPARLFAKGKVVMASGGSYERSFIQDVSGWSDREFQEKVGFLPVPAGPGGRQAVTSGGMVFTVFRQSAHQQTSLEILKRVASLPSVSKFCRNTGRRPTRISASKSLAAEGDWFSHRLTHLLETAKNRPLIPEYPKVSLQLQLMVESILSGEKTVEQAVGKAQQTIDFLTSDH